MAQAVATKAAKGSNHLEQKKNSQNKDFSDQPGREENSQCKDFSEILVVGQKDLAQMRPGQNMINYSQ